MSARKATQDFHEWAASFGWTGTAPPMEPSLWNPSNTAQMLSALEIHRMAVPDCPTCAEAVAGE